jgi:hypothetical protein
LLLLITDKIQRVRSQYESDLERLKADLQEQSEILSKRRNLYESLAEGLDVFAAGRPTTQERLERFLTDYSALWLWAPDSVVGAVTKFLKLKTILVEEPGRVDQPTVDRAYAECILEMRRSSGFPETTLSYEEYGFVLFPELSKE